MRLDFLALTPLTIAILGGTYSSWSIQNKRYAPPTQVQLQPAIDFLAKNPKHYKLIETEYKFNDSIDGRTGKSELEILLYAAMASSGNSKEFAIGGYYFLRRCLLVNNDTADFYETESIYGDAIKATHKVSDGELATVRYKAYFDHLVENNPMARKLRAQLREDLIETVAVAYVEDTKENKNTVLNKTKHLVSQKSVPRDVLINFIRLTALLADMELTTKIEQIFNRKAAYIKRRVLEAEEKSVDNYPETENESYDDIQYTGRE